MSKVAVDECSEGQVCTGFGRILRSGRCRAPAAPLQFMASLALCFDGLRGRYPNGLSFALAVLAPLDKVRAVWEHRPIVMAARLPGDGAQYPFAIHFDLFDDVHSRHGTLRIPWRERGLQNGQ